MNEQYSALRSNVSMLGKVLGETIKDALGEHILERVETIRKLSKSSRAGNDANRQELLTTLQNLSNDELLPVARAFSQFLNLADTVTPYGTFRAEQGSYALVDLFTRYQVTKNFSLQGNVNNLFDKTYDTNVEGSIVYGTPRNFSITGTYQF